MIIFQIIEEESYISILGLLWKFWKRRLKSSLAVLDWIESPYKLNTQDTWHEYNRNIISCETKQIELKHEAERI